MKTRADLTRRVVALSGAVVAAAALAGPAAAQDYPSKPITLVVAAPVGGGTDIVSRLIGQALETELKQPVIVDNRPGGSSVVAATSLAKEAPDGYTIMVTFGGHTISAAKGEKLNYDPIESFTAIGQLVSSGTLVTTLPSAPVSDLKSFMEWAKTYEGNLNIGAPAASSPDAIAATVFVKKAGLDAEVINNQGSKNALLGVLSGEYQFSFTSLASGLSMVKDGQLKGVGVTMRRPSAALPDVPSLSGALPGYVFESWYGVLAPAGVPEPIVKTLNAAINEALKDPKLQEKLTDLGLTAAPGTPEAFRQFLIDDIAFWKNIFAGG